MTREEVLKALAAGKVSIDDAGAMLSQLEPAAKPFRVVRDKDYNGKAMLLATGNFRPVKKGLGFWREVAANAKAIDKAVKDVEAGKLKAPAS